MRRSLVLLDGVFASRIKKMRAFNRAIVKDTVNILKEGIYSDSHGAMVVVFNLVDNCVRNSELFTPDYPWPSHEEKRNRYETKIECVLNTTLEASKRESAVCSKVCALVFASARKPGGGYDIGTQAQEESIARASGLVLSQRAHMGYYRANEAEDKNRLGIFTDHLIYSPQCPVFKDDKGLLLDKPYLVDFITCPAVHAGITRVRLRETADPLIFMLMRQRLAKVFSCAQMKDPDCLLLGAMGCGVFQHNPVIVARWFRELLSGPFQGVFPRVVFAVPEPAMLAVFQRTFAPGARHWG